MEYSFYLSLNFNDFTNLTQSVLLLTIASTITYNSIQNLNKISFLNSLWKKIVIPMLGSLNLLTECSKMKHISTPQLWLKLAKYKRTTKWPLFQMERIIRSMVQNRSMHSIVYARIWRLDSILCMSEWYGQMKPHTILQFSQSMQMM